MSFSSDVLGIGISVPAYQVDIRNAAAQSSIHIRSGALTDTGGWIYSIADSSIGMLAGAEYDGTNVIAKATAASSYDQNAAQHVWFTNTGLTPGTSYTETVRMILSPAGGLQLQNSDGATVGDANSAKLRYNTGTGHLEVSLNGAPYVQVVTL